MHACSMDRAKLIWLSVSASRDSTHCSVPPENDQISCASQRGTVLREMLPQMAGNVRGVVSQKNEFFDMVYQQ